jgi:hypothetical protein
VTRRLDQRDAREELGVAGDRLELQALVVGLEVRAGEQPVEAEREVLLPLVAHQLGGGVLEHLGVAGVVEVQVGQHDVVDLVEADTELVQPGVEVLLLGDVVVGEEVLQARRAPPLLPVTGAAGVPQQLALVGLHEDAVAGHVDPRRGRIPVVAVGDRAARLQQQPGQVGCHRSARDHGHLARGRHDDPLAGEG